MIANYGTAKIWIVGASSGIGRALAIELSARGATLALSARRGDELIALNAQLGGRHHVLPVDVADPAAMDEAAGAAWTALGRVDSVIFMAAIYAPARLDALAPGAARSIVDVNLNGAFNIVTACLARLKAQGGGQIALCGSVAGYRGLPAGQPYSATKAAVMNLAESLRAEEQGNNIDARLISPGFVRTPMTAKNDFAMPMMIEPEEAARAIASGLARRGFEIHFPRRFTVLMKALRLLPAALYFGLVKRAL